MVYAIPEALEALREGIRWRRSVHIEEIATLDGLLAAVPKVRLVPFVHRLLVPLVDHDKLNNGYLVSSLEAFLAPDNDISTAASQLYVRQHIAQPVGQGRRAHRCQPLDETDRTNFRIALWAARNMGMGVADTAKPVHDKVVPARASVSSPAVIPPAPAGVGGRTVEMYSPTEQRCFVVQLLCRAVRSSVV